MTTANKVFSGPVESVRPLMEEGYIPAAADLIGGMLVMLSSGNWVVHPDADEGGAIRVIDMDSIGQALVDDTLPNEQAHPAYIPEVGKTYNVVLAAGQAVARGAALSSDGAGAVKLAATDGSSEALFTADEAVTTTGATGRIRARYNPTGVNATA